VFNSFMNYHRACGSYPSAAPEFYRFNTSLSGVRVVHADTCLHVFMFLVPCCDVRYDFRVKTIFDSCVLTPICFVGGFVLIMSIVFIYVCWCTTRLPYKMMFLSFNSSTTGATRGAETANPCETHEFSPAFSGVRVSRSSVFFIMFCRSLFVLFLFGHCVVCLTIYSPDYPFDIFKLFFLGFSMKLDSSSVFFSALISLLFHFSSKFN
jgi:hypothetical protein